MIQTLKELCALQGVSSFEDPVREYLLEQARPYASQCRVDRMGNLLVYKKGERHTEHPLLVTAHMDEVGLLIRSVTREGYLRFSCIGTVDPQVLLGQRVFVGWDRIPGIIGLKAVHLTSREERTKLPKAENLYIDIGAKDGQQAQTLVQPGDFAGFDGTCTEFGSGRLKAKALDDRIGCAAALQLLERPLPVDCVFAFTVQQEVGCRGAFGAAFSLEPEIALILEAAPAVDLPNVKEARQGCRAGEGPVLTYMDGGAVYDRDLFRLLQTTAARLEIPWQMQRRMTEVTDAKAIQQTKNGTRVAGISVPVRYTHAPAGVVLLEDCRQMLTLSGGFLAAAAEVL